MTHLFIWVCHQGLQLKRHIDATLGAGNIFEAVQLPPGEDFKEWLAVNTVDFYNAISILYGTLAEFCTDRTCEVMSAGTKVGFRGPCESRQHASSMHMAAAPSWQR